MRLVSSKTTRYFEKCALEKSQQREMIVDANSERRVMKYRRLRTSPDQFQSFSFSIYPENKNNLDEGERTKNYRHKIWT